MLEEVNASELSNKYRSHQVYPYDRRYARQGEQAEDQYSLNVLNLEGESETNNVTWTVIPVTQASRLPTASTVATAGTATRTTSRWGQARGASRASQAVRQSRR